ncbi:unnamed protein product, partial [Polarella glacialis]
SDECIVSFAGMDSLEAEVHASRMGYRMAAIVCGFLCGVLVCCATFWQLRDDGKKSTYSGYEAGFYHHAIPTNDPTPEIPLSDRVQRIMNVAAARLTETSPAASGENSLRAFGGGGSHHTIQVLAPDGSRSVLNRNLAADFLDVLR